jgi:Meckel syndrome type 1 protein
MSAAAPAPPAPPAPIAESTEAAYARAPAAPPAAIAGNLEQRPMAAMKTMAVPAPMPALGDTAAHPSDTPAQELAKIRLLFALQRHDEARQRLRAFQQAHPDVALPDDLRAQLPDHE